MKKVLLSIVGVTALVVVGGYVFRAPLKESVFASITKDMFVSSDTDSFDPGPAIGKRFPSLRALRNGAVVEDMGEFIGDKGMVFIANRSVDW